MAVNDYIKQHSERNRILSEVDLKSQLTHFDQLSQINEDPLTQDDDVYNIGPSKLKINIKQQL